MSGAGSRQAEGLVDRLVHDLEPVRPVRLGRVFLACFVVQLLAVFVALPLVGIRHDLAARLAEVSFWLILLPLALAAPACATIAVRLAMPGREVRVGTSALLLALAPAIAVLLLIVAPWGIAAASWSDVIAGCWHCVGITLTTAIVPWVFIVLAVSRLAPLAEWRVSIFAGLAAFFAGALVTELHCPAADAYHVAFSHYLPIVVLAFMTSLAVAPVLRSKWASPRSQDG